MSDEDRRENARVGHHVLVGALAITAAVGVPSSVVAGNLHLKLENITGESTDQGHKDEIDVLAWSWGLNGSPRDTRGRVTPPCSVQLSISKYLDTATPALATAAALKSTISSGKLAIQTQSVPPLEYMVVDLTGVTVESTAASGANGDSKVVEAVTFGFASATITYKQVQPDGTLGSARTATVPASCP